MSRMLTDSTFAEDSGQTPTAGESREETLEARDNLATAEVAQRRVSIRPRWLLIVGLIVLIVPALFLDETVMARFREGRDGFRKVWEIVSGLGMFLMPMAILGVFPNRRRLVPTFVVAITGSAIVTQLLKLCIGRYRPYVDNGHLTFAPFTFDGQTHSFPSGHVTTAVTMAALLGIYFPRYRWVFYFYAFWVAIERMMNDKHYLSDVLAGAVIGLGTVFLLIQSLGAEYFRLQAPDQTK
ncbi:MAG: phosphatase PAP2 family protein [Phycisphaerales bacterium]|nr:phosphatase PAP2 family protein [Phycisphaerales bacterium]